MAYDLSSLMIELKNNNFEILFLSSIKKGNLHFLLEKNGIQTYSKVFKKNKFFYINHILYLVRFTKKHKIDYVYSHIQQNNFIASFAQYLSKSKFIMCRHHSDYVWNGNNRTAKLFDKVINTLAKKIIVVSKKAYTQLIDTEGVNKKKVEVINLGYNFNLYSKPDINVVNRIKTQYKSEILLLNIGRLIPLKRQMLLLQTCKNLLDSKVNFKLLILGSGRLKDDLTEYIVTNNLSKNVFLLGQVDNVIDYIFASDILIHTSESESSSTVIKEVAIANKTALVCREVGDFDSYIDDNNGYIISKNITEKELTQKLIYIIDNKSEIYKKGKLLHDTIFSKFDILNVINDYKGIFMPLR